MNNNSILTAFSNLQVVHRQKEIAKSDHFRKPPQSFDRITSVDTPRQKCVLIPSKKELMIVNISDILFVQAHGDYITVHLHNSQKHMMCKTLKSWLDEERIQFIRCHQSYAVNRMLSIVCCQSYAVNRMLSIRIILFHLLKKDT